MTVIKRSPDIGIGIRLRRVTESESSDTDQSGEQPECRIDRVIWAPIPAEMSEDIGGGEIVKWLQPPNFGGDDLQHISAEVPSLGWGAPDSTFYGLPVGAGVCGVAWTWQWDTTTGPDGGAWSEQNTVQQIGPYLSVVLKPVEATIMVWEANLTATALCNGQTAGQLHFRAYSRVG